MTGFFWPAFALFCAFIWLALRLIATELDATRQRLWTRILLIAGMIYVVLWALGTAGPFIGWRA